MLIREIIAALILYSVGAAFALVIWGYVVGRKYALFAVALASVWMASIPALAVMIFLQMGADVRGWVGRG